MTEQLKPCPFCGSKPLYEGMTGRGSKLWSLEHNDPCPFNDEDKAQILTSADLSAWNRRSGWQPIETAEPEDGKSYWVAYQFGQGEAWYIDGEWYLRETMSEPPGVTHWMPLPEPPQ